MKFEPCLLQDVAAKIPNAIVGGPFGSNLVSVDYAESGVPVIRGQNMGMGRWVDGDFVFVSEEKAKQLSQNIARPGDLVFTQRGTLGQVAIVPDSGYERYVVSQSQMKITVDPSKADVQFLYYLFNTSHQQRYIHDNSIQTGVPHTNLSILKKTPIILPPLATQIEIAEILSSLDDKIELHRRMNATLEAMAQTLFKSWFVDFDPVKTKAEGRAPDGMDADTAALFPSEFQDSELGQIPKGWRVGTIDEATSLIIDHRGKTPKKLGSEWASSGIPAISAKNIKAGRMVQKKSMNFMEQELYDRWMKDKLANGDTLMTSEAPLGELLYLTCNTELCLSQRVFALRANQENCLPAYLYFWLNSTEAQARLSGRATGTTVVGIRQAELRKVEVLLPSRNVQEKANHFFHGCLAKIETNEKETELLASTRDALLPKLISGQLRIPNIGEVEGGIE